MVQAFNVFLEAFSGVVDGFVNLSFADYSFGSIIYGGFVLGLVITIFVRVIIRR